jgi:hypothetical protein
MSSSPILSGLSAETETYPVLNGAQIGRVRPYAHTRRRHLKRFAAAGHCALLKLPSTTLLSVTMPSR